MSKQEQEPVKCVKCNAEVPLYKNGMCEVCDFDSKQAEQEPVAWCSMFGEYAHIEWGSKRTDNAIHTIPLYAAPVCTKDLTDSEIAELWVEGSTLIEFARAVIAVDREKNK